MLAGIARNAALLTLALLVSACSLSKIQPGPGPPVIAPRQAFAFGAAPIKGPNVKFGITTVTGIPGKFKFALDDSLKKFAATRSLKLTGFGDSGATYRVEGYISAIGDENKVILVYVWDVFDASGTRLHRVSGQTSAEDGATDPWTAIGQRDIDTVARATIDALADWTRV